MATDVSDSFINQYEREAHQTFQRTGAYLLPTCKLKSGVRGQAVIFQVIGKGSAVTKSRHGTITPMNVSHTPVTLTLADFYAGDWVDKLDTFKLNIDERAEIQDAAAAALGRKIDNQILTELDSTSQTAVTITVTSFAAIRAGFLQAVEDLNENDVPAEDRWGVFSPRLWSQLMTADWFIRSDYTGPTNLPYVTNPAIYKRFKSWLGVNWQMHNDVPGVRTSTAKGFVWNRNAIGYGYAMLVEGVDGPSAKADIWWDGTRAAWWVSHMMSGEAQLIDDTGVIETNHNDTTGIATS